jgi:hypothetical protein
MAPSWDAETVFASQAYDLVVLCQTVPEHVVRTLLNMASRLHPRAVIVVIDGSEEYRRLGAEIFDAQLEDPGWLPRAAVELLLLKEKQTDHTFVVRFKPPLERIHNVIASTVEIQGDNLAFLNSIGELTALFLFDMVGSWNVLSRAELLD